MSRIPESVIGEILQKTDAVAVIGDKVRLAKKGGRWIGLCPFHGEKTPSFSVDADKGLFYCFGCHKGGSVVDFLMELDKLNYREALEELASRAGVVIPADRQEDPAEDRERKSLYELHERLAGTFHWFLTSHPSGERTKEILLSRGLSTSIIEDFRLGYAPADPRWLYGFLSSKGYSADFLSRTGLFGGRTGTWPIFTDRMMFPIADNRGKVIAFGGRLLGGDGPKYLNSPETAIFKKHDTLFALDKALSAIKKESRVLICEGYMDALSFHAAGLGFAVAPLGTAFTPSQARQLKRWSDTVILCFDADEAGRKAAERSCAIAAAAGLDVKVARMQGGKDASEILEKVGGEALKKIPDSTINGGDFLVRRARELFDVSTVEGKSKAIGFLYPYIGALDSEVKRSAFIESASRELGANPVSVRADYESAARTGAQRGQARERDHAEIETSQAGMPARTGDLVLLSALVLNPERFGGIRESLVPGDLDDARARDLYFALEESWRAGERSVEAALARVGDEAARRFVLSVAAAGELSANADRFIDDGLAVVKRRTLERRRERLLSAMAHPDASEDGDGPSLNDLLYEKMTLDTELAALKGEVDERS